MNVLSTAQITPRARIIIRSLGSTVAGFIVLSAVLTLQGWNLLIALCLALLVFSLLLAVSFLTVRIEADDDALLLQMPPFTPRKIQFSSITEVTPTHPTSLLEGYGYRILGRKHRGLLVGGPAIKLSVGDATEPPTPLNSAAPHQDHPRREILTVSAHDPETVTSTIINAARRSS